MTSTLVFMALLLLADGDVGVDSHRARFHAALGAAHVADLGPQVPDELHGLVGRADVGFRHDLHKGRPGPVEIDQAHGGPALELVDQLGHVLLHVDVADAEPLRGALLIRDVEPSPPGQGMVAWESW